MKFSALALALTTLGATIAHAAECDLKLYDAVSIPELDKCETEAGFDFVALATPTDDVKAKFCKSEACITIWQAAKSAAPEECLVKGKELYKDVLDPLEAACKKAGVALTGNTTTSKVDHTHSGGSKGSSDMGKKNKTSHHGSGSEDSSDDDSAVKAPSNSTKPTTAPSSAGVISSLSISVGIAVLSLTAAALL